MPDNKFGFGKVKQAVILMKKDLPEELANNAQKYFVNSFNRQSWNGEKWKEVQRRIPGTPAYKYPKNKDKGRKTRPILIGKGSTKLRRAVNNSIRSKTFKSVLLLVDLPYAKAHNEGIGNMPKRTFMGNTNELDAQQKRIIKKYMGKIHEL